MKLVKIKQINKFSPINKGFNWLEKKNNNYLKKKKKNLKIYGKLRNLRNQARNIKDKTGYFQSEAAEKYNVIISQDYSHMARKQHITENNLKKLGRKPLINNFNKLVDQICKSSDKSKYKIAEKSFIEDPLTASINNFVTNFNQALDKLYNTYALEMSFSKPKQEFNRQYSRIKNYFPYIKVKQIQNDPNEKIKQNWVHKFNYFVDHIYPDKEKKQNYLNIKKLQKTKSNNQSHAFVVNFNQKIDGLYGYLAKVRKLNQTKIAHYEKDTIIPSYIVDDYCKALGVSKTKTKKLHRQAYWDSVFFASDKSKPFFLFVLDLILLIIAGVIFIKTFLQGHFSVLILFIITLYFGWKLVRYSGYIEHNK